MKYIYHVYGGKFFILYTNSSANTGNAEGKMVIEKKSSAYIF